MKKIVLFLILTISIQSLYSQSSNKSKAPEKHKISMVLLDYIEGTSNGEPDRLKNAFDRDLNLYSVQDNKLSVLSGQKYISYFKKGEKRNRIGKVVSIDFVNDVAMAKIEIDVPYRKRLYTDYLMLLKIEGEWKIIHKSYTYVSYSR
tara:strand:- start:45052 stop:45492 length:441 start_codon:yes stop_codon:yes gene_type:complete